MFRVIVAGSRTFNDYGRLECVLNHLLSNTMDDIEIVCGAARGADALGEQYALKQGFSLRYFPAEWERYGRTAGYRRNEQMAEYADALIAFWDGQSKGTRHMIDLAQKYNLKCRVIRF